MPGMRGGVSTMAYIGASARTRSATIVAWVSGEDCNRIASSFLPGRRCTAQFRTDGSYKPIARPCRSDTHGPGIAPTHSRRSSIASYPSIGSKCLTVIRGHFRFPHAHAPAMDRVHSIGIVLGAHRSNVRGCHDGFRNRFARSCSPLPLVEAVSRARKAPQH